MKSIKEKAEEFNKIIRVINESESIVSTQGSKMFEAGANYVLEEIEKLLDEFTNYEDSLIVRRVIE